MANKAKGSMVQLLVPAIGPASTVRIAVWACRLAQRGGHVGILLLEQLLQVLHSSAAGAPVSLAVPEGGSVAAIAVLIPLVAPSLAPILIVVDSRELLQADLTSELLPPSAGPGPSFVALALATLLSVTAPSIPRLGREGLLGAWAGHAVPDSVFVRGGVGAGLVAADNVAVPVIVVERIRGTCACARIEVAKVRKPVAAKLAGWFVGDLVAENTCDAELPWDVRTTSLWRYHSTPGKLAMFTLVSSKLLAPLDRYM
eukprot:CAMPEP_0179200302 /NCGR_PEP_ID=MMETSP0796-20121207/99684_1 /TAXON_ID=73915 /ORGANISM="Pyrodinium bahamense, Strain pbaha01" /LENGTH=256 /DNA_ID=CAMNT_0020904857 /DNA_START=60 /DNA_END=831 /DNA_ORIENTATION=+